MGKQGISRLLCAYETNLPGSAAEKLAQRADLESMLNQLEEESVEQATTNMPSAHENLAQSLQAMQQWHAQWQSLDSSSHDTVTEEALQAAEKELSRWQPGISADSTGIDDGGAAPNAPAEPPAPPAAAAPSQRNRAHELRKERGPLMGNLRAAVEKHARFRRDVEQGGCIPAHFVTLTTAIYHWADLADVLEEYERRTTANRHGRRDPDEPGEAALPDHKRRVLQYSGVVAWYCALKLELYASCVVQYDDIFGVFEWGSGGIVHLHLLGWRFPGLGRYDYEQGEVPTQQRKEDARAMAWQHGAEVSEWNLARKDMWTTSDGFDEELTEQYPPGEYGHPPLTDDSDSDSNDPEGGAVAEEPASEAIMAGMRELAELLRDTQWHPSALPMHLKRMLLTSRCAVVRRMRRWYYTALINKTHMHDRHSGDPVSIPPVYGDDSATDTPDDDDAEAGAEDGQLGSATSACNVRILTWNTSLQTSCQFVAHAAQSADVLCLQEVTPAGATWLQEHIGKDFDVIAPPQCGGAWDTEGHGVAIAVRRQGLEAQAPHLHALPSGQQRSLMTVRVKVRGTSLVLLVATAHLESGAEATDSRQEQLRKASELMKDNRVDGAVFAADCNLRRGEEATTFMAKGLGEDAWLLAGSPEDSRWTWLGPAKGSAASTTLPQRFDRIFVQGRKAMQLPGKSSLELCDASFALLDSDQTDHRGVRCILALAEAREKQKQRRFRALGEPLRAGARARLGTAGVARRPKKTEPCAKVEPHTEHDEGGPTYYCGKHFEKPRIQTGDAAILEDERRKGLWRLHLPRNCAHVNSHLAALAIALGANTDCQPILTAKGVADYVCKYITKYGAGQSVSSRIASLLDEIVSRVPEGRTMTIASLLAKAFIATAVPDSLCCLEAWHILWGLPRTVSSRFFKGLNMDGLTGVKQPKDVKKEGEQGDGQEQKDKPTMIKKPIAQLYATRTELPCKDPKLRAALPEYNLLRFAAELDMRGHLTRRPKARVMNLKPYLQLDVTKATAGKHAKMALRMLRPWEQIGNDPMELKDDQAALEQLEAFARDPSTPRWFRKRFEHHNRERQRQPPQPRATKMPPPATAAASASAAPAAASATLSAKMDAVRAHGLQWERNPDTPAWSVRESLQQAKGKAPVLCLKEMLRYLGAVQGPFPRGRAALVEQLVLHILFVDLQDYVKAGKGYTKKCLPKQMLQHAAQAWMDYHQSSIYAEDRKALSVATQAYATLWNVFKRVVLQECGLHVVRAPSRRVYFTAPYSRPRGPHAPEKEGRWRQPVTAPCAWLPGAEDSDNAMDRDMKPNTYVRSAAYEQSMGAGGLPHFEVPVPEDEDALDSPDKGTKVEWDAIWPVEDRVQRKACGDPDAIRADADRLRWVRPERDNGATAKEYAEALRQHPNPRAADVPVSLEKLDPTQRSFADLVLTWARVAQPCVSRPQPHFFAVLLGTAGTGKTTTLQAVLERLQETGFRRILVSAYTGVAASNVGCGARTLHDLFQLSKVNAVSGELLPLGGKDLEKLAEDLDDLRLLVIDEISMVSRAMLADVDSRLKEWRAFRKHSAKDAAFGGVGVILAGDFGQLPPTKAEHLSLLCPNVLHCLGFKRANHGLRLFDQFTTVVRLRRIHRQPGASTYKESLIRLRDGAMTKEDHALWSKHDLAADGCTFTPQQRATLEGKVTHLFAENAGAGERNGFMAGCLAEQEGKHILRVASRDNTAAASRQACDAYGQLRRVVHIVEGAPVMIICNLRTPAGLVNGATGKVVGTVLRRSEEDKDIRGAVSAADVEYVVVDVPSYRGPVIFPEHDTWVPIQPVTVKHKRMKGWERLQLPLVLAWGITIHKSQGLTFPDGAVVDFAHHPSTQPVANVGLAFVAMSRTREWLTQGFRDLPDFWEFRKVLKDKLFKWRGILEARMDALHDATMAVVLGRPFTVEEDVRMHREWSEQQLGRSLTSEEVRDLNEMLQVRGLRPAPTYTDEPEEDRRGPKGGGGRKHGMGMKPPPAKKPRTAGTFSKQETPHDEDAARQKRPRQEVVELGGIGCENADGLDDTSGVNKCGVDATGGPDEPEMQEGAADDNAGVWGGDAAKHMDLPMQEESHNARTSLHEEMSGNAAPAGWYCALLARHVGAAVLAPPWFKPVQCGHDGWQRVASCGVHAVNHCLHSLGLVLSWHEFDSKAMQNERAEDGDWKAAALQRNLEEAGARMQPMTNSQHQALARWCPEFHRIGLWTPGTLACVVHVPGHWVAITRPEGEQTAEAAALLCDPFYTRPFSLSADILQELFAAMGDGGPWSVHIVTRTSEPQLPRPAQAPTCVCQQIPCICCERSPEEVASNRCNACGKVGCWRRHPQCTFFNRSPDDHPDALPGDTVPHIRQLSWRPLGQSRQSGNELVEVEGRTFAVGFATGDDNNCLIDTLRQKLPGLVCNLTDVRDLLQKHFASGPTKVTAGNFLELEHHWWHVIRFLGAVSNSTFIKYNPDHFRVICVDLAFPGNGDVVGTGPRVLHIARVRTNHFVPLIPCHGADQGNPARI